MRGLPLACSFADCVPPSVEEFDLVRKLSPQLICRCIFILLLELILDELDFVVS